MSKNRHHPILQRLGSLNLAIFILVFLSALLTVATYVEGQYGTRNANLWIYKTAWFDVVLSLVFINIFFATWVRMPFKRHQTGFVMTHFGILIILAGSFVTRQIGEEGMLSLFEKETSNAIVQEGTLFEVSQGQQNLLTLDTDFFEDKSPYISFPLESSNHRILVEKVSAHSEEAYEYETASLGLKAQPAVRYSLNGQMADLEDRWLATHNPNDPQSHKTDIGPASIELIKAHSKEELRATLEGPKASMGTLVISKEGQDYTTISVDQLSEAVQTLPDGTQLEFLDYYPFATVIENTLQNDPAEQFENPAVRFALNMPDGSTEPILRFQNIPEFKSSREKQTLYSFSYQDARVVRSRPNLKIIAGPDATLHYSSLSSNGRTTGVLQPGKKAHTGWMDFTLTVHEFIEHSRAAPSVIMVKKSAMMKSVRPAIRFRILDDRQEYSKSHLVRYGEDFELFADGQKYHIKYGPKLLYLPFSITLEDFRKIDYPGTNRAKSYESDVTVTDPETSPAEYEKTIKMNHILIHQGWKFYQADFEILGDGREISRLQVGYDPGTPTIYFGSILMVLGIITMFWIKPRKTPKSPSPEPSGV